MTGALDGSVQPHVSGPEDGAGPLLPGSAEELAAAEDEATVTADDGGSADALLPPAEEEATVTADDGGSADALLPPAEDADAATLLEGLTADEACALVPAMESAEDARLLDAADADTAGDALLLNAAPPDDDDEDEDEDDPEPSQSQAAWLSSTAIIHVALLLFTLGSLGVTEAPAWCRQLPVSNILGGP